MTEQNETIKRELQKIIENLKPKLDADDPLRIAIENYEDVSKWNILSLRNEEALEILSEINSIKEAMERDRESKNMLIQAAGGIIKILGIIFAF